MDESNKSTNVLVIYHKDCNDGFAAAWVARKVHPNAQFHPAAHGTPPPDVKNRDVILLDFAYKREVMLDIKKAAKSVLVLDHHKTAADNLKGLDFCHFDMSKSGATMSWDYFVGGERPWLVAYTEDRDLDRFVLPFSREINAAIESHHMDFNLWDKLDKLYTKAGVTNSTLVAEGASILRYQDQLLNVIIDHAREVELDGHRILAANTSCIFGQAATRLAKTETFGLAWYLREDGKFIHSLRSRPDGIDVSEIAKRHGGGGHVHSAGFETDTMILQEVG